ncbi:protein-tyrosine phosphatase-like protein [Mycotypha africana]|uniref:protein-tyrosine phosphatase-like protein n=1 Tax=Mycotypha africana TaxID=64632 RepID=UPI002300C120|nr:protein-tyrosine phosphatase-like protein [Mycotypha africana]KAI8991121.1 protein-tyrosine phosphatase-like protein [Mycotypha africana]
MYNSRNSSNNTRYLINPPTHIEYHGLRFLIVDAPSSNNLPLYIKEFEHWHVTDVVRCCEATYPKEPLHEKHIQVHDFVFADGEAPPTHIIDAWLHLIQERFKKNKDHLPTGSDEVNEKSSHHLPPPPPSQPSSCIATHCVAGLGRAPVLVAIALIEEGMPALDAVQYIRERRRGAINKKQLKFVESYKPKSQSRCTIM